LICYSSFTQFPSFVAKEFNSQIDFNSLNLWQADTLAKFLVQLAAPEKPMIRKRKEKRDEKV
jgi:hypothetical protein